MYYMYTYLYIQIYIYLYIYWGVGFQGIRVLSESPGMRFCSRSKLKRPIQFVQNGQEFNETMTFCLRSNEIWLFSIFMIMQRPST